MVPQVGFVLEVTARSAFGLLGLDAKLDIVESASHTPPLERDAPHAIVGFVGCIRNGLHRHGEWVFDRSALWSIVSNWKCTDG